MDSDHFFSGPAREYRDSRIAHWDAVARKRDRWHGLGYWYHRRIAEIYSFLVGPGRSVLEIGCGQGDLLAALRPSHGVGVDFSEEHITRGQKKYPQLELIRADAHELSPVQGSFDAIIFSDTINDLWDVQRALEQVRPFCSSRTRLILNFYSHLWEWPLAIVRWLHLATPNLDQNWLTREDVSNMLMLAGFEPIRFTREVLWPLPLGGFANRFLVRFWLWSELALANFVIARPVPPAQGVKAPQVSVIVPARNEAGNIKSIFERVPRMGEKTELVFVEGHSRDDTYATIEREMAAHPQLPSLLFRQPGVGKADAVRMGFSKAHGEILMILDADLTVPPEDLPRFYSALVSGKGEFINGVRLVYPMEKEAMRIPNLLGNKFFSMAFSWLLGQPIKDTLCGTKALWREDYDRISGGRAYFGDFDPFGDFDLIFGAAKLNCRIVDMPIRYQERSYGTTNISRWRHGFLLLRMVLFAAQRIKFV